MNHIKHLFQKKISLIHSDYPVTKPDQPATKISFLRPTFTLRRPWEGAGKEDRGPPGSRGAGGDRSLGPPPASGGHTGGELTDLHTSPAATRVSHWLAGTLSYCFLHTHRALKDHIRAVRLGVSRPLLLCFSPLL